MAGRRAREHVWLDRPAPLRRDAGERGPTVGRVARCAQRARARSRASTVLVTLVGWTSSRSPSRPSGMLAVAGEVEDRQRLVLGAREPDRAHHGLVVLADELGDPVDRQRGSEVPAGVPAVRASSGGRRRRSGRGRTAHQPLSLCLSSRPLHDSARCGTYRGTTARVTGTCGRTTAPRVPMIGSVRLCSHALGQGSGDRLAVGGPRGRRRGLRHAVERSRHRIPHRDGRRRASSRSTRARRRRSGR